MVNVKALMKNEQDLERWDKNMKLDVLESQTLRSTLSLLSQQDYLLPLAVQQLPLLAWRQLIVLR